MKVKRLIELLSLLPGDDEVVMEDGHGSGHYVSLGGISADYMFSEEWNVIGFAEISKEMEAQGYGEDDILTAEDAVRAVLLW